MESLPVRKKIRLPHLAYRQQDAFSITTRTHKQYPWFQNHPDFAGIGAKLLRQTVAERGASLYAWCIMPDHIHILLQDKDIIDFMRLFKGRMTPKAFAKERNRKLWQRSYYDHALRKEETLLEVARYILENPVRASLVKSPLEYEWSGSEVWSDWREFYREDKHSGRG